MTWEFVASHHMCFGSCLMILFAQTIWVFPKIVVPQNGWFITENPIKMDDLGGKPTIFGNTHTISATLWTSLDRTPCLWSILVVYCKRNSSSTMSMEHYSTKVLLSTLPLKVDTTSRKSRQMYGEMFSPNDTLPIPKQFLCTVETITPFINCQQIPKPFKVQSHQQQPLSISKYMI